MGPESPTPEETDPGLHRPQNEECPQEHEDGGRDDLIDDVDVLGEAVDDAPGRGGVIEGLWGVEFVLQQRSMEGPGGVDASHGQGEGADQHYEP